ncbi:hypothetical protein C0991_009379 [Blastosporella zonata]|nr:hypothetical protein C0991_009379 [Blastosporella zonata]
MRFTSLFVLSSLIVSGFATPAADFVKQIKALSTELSGLTTVVNEVPAKNGLAQALKAYAAARHLNRSLADSTKELLVTGFEALTSFSETESSANLAAAKDLEVIAEASLDAILAKKDAFNAMSVLSIVRGEIKNLGAATQSWEDALIDHTFKAHLAAGTALRDKLSHKFDATINELNN